jgi:hypothetical protein
VQLSKLLIVVEFVEIKEAKIKSDKIFCIESSVENKAIGDEDDDNEDDDEEEVMLSLLSLLLSLFLSFLSFLLL